MALSGTAALRKFTVPSGPMVNIAARSGIWLMFSPGATLRGLDAYDKPSARDTAARLQKLEKDRRQKEIDAAITSGVVTVGIEPKKH